MFVRKQFQISPKWITPNERKISRGSMPLPPPVCHMLCTWIHTCPPLWCMQSHFATPPPPLGQKAEKTLCSRVDPVPAWVATSNTVFLLLFGNLNEQKLVSQIQSVHKWRRQNLKPCASKWATRKAGNRKKEWEFVHKTWMSRNKTTAYC